MQAGALAKRGKPGKRKRGILIAVGLAGAVVLAGAAGYAMKSAPAAEQYSGPTVRIDDRDYVVPTVPAEIGLYVQNGTLQSDISMAASTFHVAYVAAANLSLYERDPRGFFSWMRRWAGNDATASFAVIRLGEIIDSGLYARIVAEAERQEFFQQPIIYGAKTFLSNYGRELRAERSRGIITNSQGEYGVLTGRDVKWYGTFGEALRENKRQEAIANAPTPIYTHVERKGNQETRTTHIGPQRPPAVWESEIAKKKDPVWRAGEALHEGRHRDAAKEAGKAMGTIIDSYRQAAPPGLRDFVQKGREAVSAGKRK